MAGLFDFVYMNPYHAMLAIKNNSKILKDARESAKERPLNILLVEDNADNRKLINLYLKKNMHKVDIAKILAAGCNEFITKPVKKQTTLNAIS